MKILKNDWMREAGVSFDNANNQAPSTGVGNSAFPATNIIDPHPGIGWVGAPVIEAPTTPTIRVSSGGTDPDATVTWTWVRRQDGSSGNLAALQAAIQSVSADFSNTLVTRSATTGKVTIDLNNGAMAFGLIWTWSADTQATGTALGYDTSSDDTPGPAHEADDPIRYNNVAFIVDLGDTRDFDVVAFVGHNLVENDVVSIRAHASDLGDDKADWSSATFSQDYTVTETETRNPILRVGLDSSVSKQWLAVFITSNTGRTADDLRIGVMQVGQELDYSSGDAVEAPEHQRSMSMGGSRTAPEYGAVIPPTRQTFDLECVEWSHSDARSLQDLIESEFARRPTCVWLDTSQISETSDDTVYGKIGGTISTRMREGDICTFRLRIVGMTRGF